MLYKDERLDLINLLRDEISNLETMGDMFPIGRNVLVYARETNPVSLDDDENLPAIFFGSGETSLVDGDESGLDKQTELLQLVVNAAINQVFDESEPPQLVEGGDLISQEKKLHRSLEIICAGIVAPDHLEGTVVQTRVIDSTPTTQGLSDIELTQFTIEIEWQFVAT